jgi:hypothetical protein
LIAAATQQEPFKPGQFEAVIMVCEGTCGSQYPNSFTLSERAQKFVIVPK